MRKNDSAFKKLIPLKEDEVLIAGCSIKEVVPRSYFQSEASSIGALKEMYFVFVDFNMKFTQDEFIHGDDDNLQVEIFIDALPDSNLQEITEKAQRVFQVLKGEYLQSELEGVEPTIVS